MATIKRVKGGYQVFSSNGKAISKPGLRRSTAEKRLESYEHLKKLHYRKVKG